MRRMVIAAVALAACGGALPQTHYYQLATPTPAATSASKGATIAVEPLSTDAAYDDERIVYRVDPVRLDYYDYHHWSTTPGAMIATYLQQALAASGKFGSVMRDASASTAIVVGGHVTAIEEVDDSKQHWTGHIAVELTATDPKSGAVVWSHAYDEREPLSAQTPEGLAHALSTAMARIASAAAPAICQRAAAPTSDSTCASISSRE